MAFVISAVLFGRPCAGPECGGGGELSTLVYVAGALTMVAWCVHRVGRAIAAVFTRL